MKWQLATIILVLYTGFLVAQNQPEITAQELQDHVTWLASDSLKGRKPGMAEADIAAGYILKQFEAAGLDPISEKGFQFFYVVTGVTLGDENELVFRNYRGEFREDFIPLAFSSPGEAVAPILFAGYGFYIDQDSLKWSDYSGVDTRGKWVMIFRGDPEPDNQQSLFIPFSDIRSKILTAKDQGAAGVLLVTPEGMEKSDKLMPLVVENNEVTSGIPVINIKRELADSLLSTVGYTVDDLEHKIISEKKPHSFEIPVVVAGKVDLIQEKERTANVVALLEGSDPELKNEYLIIGAHYDHLGFGGPNSGSRVPDTNAIHNGADDNASGTAMIIELAGKLASHANDLKRSIIFIAFSAEEMGLIGSRYFVDHSPVKLNQIKGMFNFDMVGRFDPDKGSISVSGTGTSAESDSILLLYEKDMPFNVVHSPDGYGPSDHAAFYAVKIPVFYFTTGAHTDYHTPVDDTEKLDFLSAKQIGDFAANLIMHIDTMSKPLTFKESGKTEGSGRMGRKLKVTLGIMPDFAGTEKRGLRVDGVTKEGPADRGGMLKGDVIISINGLKVGNIYEYMSRLGTLKHGQTIIVEVIRGEKPEVLLIQL